MRALTPKRRLASAGTAAVLAVVAATLAAGCSAPPSQHAAAVGALLAPGIPRYYVALDRKGPVSISEPLAAAATVRVTASGAVIARIVAPRPYLGFVALTGAADDRSFVLAAHAQVDPFNGVVPERLFLLRIDPGARSATARARLTALPVSNIPGGHEAIHFNGEVETMALSPDGSSLAAILNYKDFDGVYTYNLATGLARSWLWYGRSDPGGLSNALLSRNPSIPALSWTSDDSAVAFTFLYNYPTLWTQLRLLHLSAGGHDVLADSSPVTITHSQVWWSQAVMTADGMTVLLNFTQMGLDAHPTGSMLRISTATGQQATVNTLPSGETAGYVGQGPLTADTLLWANDNGSLLVVADARPGHTLGFYSGGRYTALPWPSGAVVAAW